MAAPFTSDPNGYHVENDDEVVFEREIDGVDIEESKQNTSADASLGAPIDIFERHARTASLEDIDLGLHNPSKSTTPRVNTLCAYIMHPNRKFKFLIIALAFCLLFAALPTTTRSDVHKNNNGSNNNNDNADITDPKNVDVVDPKDAHKEIDSEEDDIADLYDKCTQEALFPSDTALLDLLSSVTPSAVLNNPCSIQHQAVYWLLTEELAGKTSNKLRIQPVMLQRYAVLLLDLALGADVAQPGVSTCDWQGVSCQDEQGQTFLFVKKLVWADQGLTGSFDKLGGAAADDDKGGQELTALARSLEHLDLGENDITGSLPDALFELKKLTKLYLHNNRLTGTLSERFSNLRKLQYLYLGQNEFFGTLPRGLGSNGTAARPLRYLSLYQNNLTGPLPQHLNWRFVYYLDLSHNAFTGPIPSDWVDGGHEAMLHVRHLFLNDNRFSGPLPETLPRLGNGRIQLLHLGNNEFTGKVPGGFNPINLLESLEVQGNQFSELSPDICQMIVFLPPSSELANLKVDCDICICEKWCEPGYCYEKPLSP